ncbi:MAG: iron-sulfur cluster assembly scaffold protein [Candidatus Gracilibacteria bacterium]|nr:iron-sulfur cluster assembly scaffold protein [Candidatus Gracilibacteria bacterium]
MSAVYTEIFLEYAKNPPNKGILEDATIKHFEENRNCGDALTVFLKLDDTGMIEDFSFEGNTAIVTTACTSIFGESIIGMNISDILTMNFETVREMIGFQVSSRRKQASVLGLLATRNAIHIYLGDGIVDDFSDVLIG